MKPKWMKQIVTDSCIYAIDIPVEWAQWQKMLEYRRYVLPYSSSNGRDAMAVGMLQEIKRLRKKLRDK